MGSKVIAAQEKDRSAEEPRPSTIVRVRARRHVWTTQWRLRLAWSVLVLFPWCLQVRGIVQLALPHTVPQLLAVGDKSAKETEDLVSHCPVQSLMIAGVWWNIMPTHFFSHHDGETICHYITQQYNIHGHYCIGSNSTAAPPVHIMQSLPAHCRPNPDRIQIYYYHGTIGYYSFYTAGRGVYCSEDATGYVAMIDLGSADINGEVLAQDAGGEKDTKRLSYWYLCIGSLWIVYRAVVLHRSWVLCSQHANRCERMKESLSNRGIVVFVQESARLVAHNASTLQRIIVLYALIEGLMADLFLQITKYGLSVRLQYFSIGYNLASLLSVLFDMIEGRWKGGKSSYVLLIARRVFFNLETGFMGELVCTAIFREYLDALNRSRFKDSVRPAQLVSYYFWSLVAHGVIVVGLIGTILAVRVFGALVITRMRFGTIRVLAAPSCVDVALRGRLRAVMLSGYVWRDGNLYYSRESLKAFGIFRSIDEVIRNQVADVEVERGAQELLVHLDAPWVAFQRKPNLVVVGLIIGRYVEPCKVQRWNGQVLHFCDRILGGFAIQRENR